MGKFIRKHSFISLTIVALVVVGLAVLIQLTKGSNDVAKWVFDFFNDWSSALSASAAITLIITFLWNLRENRRSKIRDVLIEWIKESVKILMDANFNDSHLLEKIIKVEDEGLVLYLGASSLGKGYHRLMEDILDTITAIKTNFNDNNKDECNESLGRLMDLYVAFQNTLINE